MGLEGGGGELNYDGCSPGTEEYIYTRGGCTDLFAMLKKPCYDRDIIWWGGGGGHYSNYPRVVPRKKPRELISLKG